MKKTVLFATVLCWSIQSLAVSPLMVDDFETSPPALMEPAGRSIASTSNAPSFSDGVAVNIAGSGATSDSAQVGELLKTSCEGEALRGKGALKHTGELRHPLADDLESPGVAR